MLVGALVINVNKLWPVSRSMISKRLYPGDKRSCAMNIAGSEVYMYVDGCQWNWNTAHKATHVTA